MEKLIQKLKKFTIELEKDQNKIFVLESGQDITEYIKLCHSPEDILTLANKLRDELIDNENADDYEELNGFRKNFAEANATGYVDRYGDGMEQENLDSDNELEDHSIAKGIIEKYHGGILNEESMPEDVEEEEDSFECEVEQILANLGLDANWETWGQCFGSLGYKYPQMLDELQFRSPCDIIDVMDYNEDDPNPETTDEEKLLYVHRFYAGELVELEILLLANSVIEYCKENGDEDEYVEAEGEYEEEMEEDLDNFYQMVKSECNLLRNRDIMNNFHKRLRLAEDEEGRLDYDMLSEIGDEIEVMHEIEEDVIFDEYGSVDGRLSEKRKRYRVQFDMQDDPIPEMRFEQEQTDLLLDKHAMKMLIGEIAQDYSGEDIDFTPDAIEAIQVAAEDYLIKMFQDANLVAVTGDLTHIQPKHIQVVRHIMKDDD